MPFTEDELVSLDELQDKVQEFEDYVQSTDVAAMQSEFFALSVVRRTLTVNYRAVNIPIVSLVV